MKILVIDDHPLVRSATPKRPSGSPADLDLTDRQVEVLSLMMQGKSNKAICRIVNLAEPTGEESTAILKALKVSNRTEAVIAVGELGWKLPPVSKSWAALGLSGHAERSGQNGDHARRLPPPRAMMDLRAPYRKCNKPSA